MYLLNLHWIVSTWTQRWSSWRGYFQTWHNPKPLGSNQSEERALSKLILQRYLPKRIETWLSQLEDSPGSPESSRGPETCGIECRMEGLMGQQGNYHKVYYYYYKVPYTDKPKEEKIYYMWFFIYLFCVCGRCGLGKLSSACWGRTGCLPFQIFSWYGFSEFWRCGRIINKVERLTVERGKEMNLPAKLAEDDSEPAFFAAAWWSLERYEAFVHISELSYLDDFCVPRILRSSILVKE